MNIVSWGGGSNSTAMIIGMYHRKVPIDLILFADVGCELPETYAFLREFSQWLKNKGLPKITVVKYQTKHGEQITLEQDLLRTGLLPPPCYGGKSCSIKFKIVPQDKFCKTYQPCIDVWDKGEKCVKYVGYDAGEERRKENAVPHDIVDKLYTKQYPLIDWGWDREKCVEVIKEQGLTLPGKSSCFFCPNMKKKEVISLYRKHIDLFIKATQLESIGMQSVYSPGIKGLGRYYSWEKYGKVAGNQVEMCFPEDDDNSMPCGCYDG